MTTSKPLTYVLESSRNMLAWMKALLLGVDSDRTERRHPAQIPEDDIEILQRRKDDNVGGEGG
jgi:hypothetical protein